MKTSVPTVAKAEPYLSNAPRVRVARTIRQWIGEGHLPRGERLPSEQALAEQMSVSRLTVRAALRELEEQGLLECFPRRGRVVAENVQPTRSPMADVVAILDDPHKGGGGRRHSGWHQAIHDGASEAIHSVGLHVLTLNPEKLDAPDFDHVLRARPNGMIVLKYALDDEHGRRLAAALKSANIPFVVYGQSPQWIAADTVTSDHAAGAYELARWLISRGCRRILRYWAWQPELHGRPHWLAQRDEGYERACREAGIEPLPAVDYNVPHASPNDDPRAVHDRDIHTVAGYLIPHFMGEQKIDAVMGISDGVTYAIRDALRLFNVQPTRDVLVVGYDNYWAEAPARRWSSESPLAATVDKLNFELGEALVQLLQERVTGRLPAEPQHRLVQPKLVVIGE
jgi:DNA-binding LacI/PurR family transcriptional regulator